VKQIDINKLSQLGAIKEQIREFLEAEGIDRTLAAYKLMQHEGFPMVLSILQAILSDAELLEAILSVDERDWKPNYKQGNGHH
jgi:hypothetical protein